MLDKEGRLTKPVVNFIKIQFMQCVLCTEQCTQLHNALALPSTCVERWATFRSVPFVPFVHRTFTCPDLNKLVIAMQLHQLVWVSSSHYMDGRKSTLLEVKLLSAQEKWARRRWKAHVMILLIFSTSTLPAHNYSNGWCDDKSSAKSKRKIYLCRYMPFEWLLHRCTWRCPGSLADNSRY